MAVDTVAINILLRWSKEGFRFVCCVRIVNRYSKPISRIELTYEKLSKL